MQLPFVLKSAETMKKAVAYLEPMMEKAEGSTRGRIVLATVSGDVHDIGKNLVDIILTNNGYEVHNLGIKIGISEMIAKFEETSADAIGMSGLLVKSTLIMRDNLEELERRGLGKVPVLLGGAALTRNYVEADLRSRYQGPLYYGKNAFAGLEAMGKIVAGSQPPSPIAARQYHERETEGGVIPARSPDEAGQSDLRPALHRVPGDPGSLDRRDRPLSQPDCPLPEPVAVPAGKGGSGTSISRSGWRRSSESRSPWLVMTTCSTPRWSTGTSRRMATATTSSSGTTSAPRGS